MMRATLLAMLFVLRIDVGTAGELELLINEDFTHGADRMEPTDAAAWQVAETPEGKVYRLLKQSNYKPPHRSPLNFALLRDVVVGDFELTVRAHSTTRDYDHRDLCLVFGYQDPAHFYYVHFGKRTDDHANQVFIVKDAPRAKISTSTTPGTPWTDGWHTLRVARGVDDGSIRVYFDDLRTPAMTATDKTFTWGRVGVGSFDDTGEFDDLELRGVRVERP